MTRSPLVASELELVLSVLRQHPEIESAILFGSRAKGTHSDRSDVDLALTGSLGALGAEAIAAELEELPLPYRFDVHALAAITHTPLLEHIERVGIEIYRGNDRAINTSAQSRDHDVDPITAFRGSGPGGSTARLLAERHTPNSLVQKWLG
jgi:predicted nucleotidyltransferase